LKPAAISWERVLELKAKQREVVGRAESSKPPLTEVLPQPVTLRLGGRDWEVIQFQLKDLAALQGFIEQCVPHPLRELPPAWLDADPDSRPARLRAAYEEAGRWPPRFGTPEGGRLLATPEGTLFFALLALRKCRPETSVGEVVEAVAAASPPELGGVSRAVYGVSPWRAVADEIDPDDEGPARLCDWARAFYTFAERYGWTPQQVGELYLGQWRVLASEGRGEARGKILRGESLRAAAARWREALGRLVGRVTGGDAGLSDRGGAAAPQRAGGAEPPGGGGVLRRPGADGSGGAGDPQGAEPPGGAAPLPNGPAAPLGGGDGGSPGIPVGGDGGGVGSLREVPGGWHPQDGGPAVPGADLESQPPADPGDPDAAEVK
jgi:hypothetical protein